MIWATLFLISMTLVRGFDLGREDCLESKQTSLFCKSTFSALKALAQKGSNDGPQPCSETHPCHEPTALGNTTLSRYRALARLQYVGYCETDVQTWTCGICQDDASPIKNTTRISQFSAMARWGITSFGMVGVSHDLGRTFVVFQGAIHRIEWLRCYEYFQKVPQEIGVPDPIKVHSGFYRSYREVRAQVVNELLEKSRLYPHYPITILGHSYGGALASLLALDIAKGNLRKFFDPSHVELITFGAPRVGNAAYADAMNKAKWHNLARLVHTTDLFVHLPPRAPAIGMPYVHHGGEIWLSTRSHRWIKCEVPGNQTGESAVCANSVPWTKLNIEAHISYTTQRAFKVCPFRPMREPIDVEYLPNYLS